MKTRLLIPFARIQSAWIKTTNQSQKECLKECQPLCAFYCSVRLMLGYWSALLYLQVTENTIVKCSGILISWCFFVFCFVFCSFVKIYYKKQTYRLHLKFSRCALCCLHGLFLVFSTHGSPLCIRGTAAAEWRRRGKHNLLLGVVISLSLKIFVVWDISVWEHRVRLDACEVKGFCYKKAKT